MVASFPVSPIVEEEEKSAADQPKSAAKSTEFKCLIANDDSLQLTILEALFERANFEVVTATNGQDAYEEVLKTTSGDQRQFDLILLDLSMPITDGYEACKLILAHYKSDIQLHNVEPKLVAVTGYIDEEVQRKAASCGFEVVYE